MKQKIYKTKILRRTNIARDTTALYLEKPEGFTFKPGQYTRLHFEEKVDYSPDGFSRYLSIASYPDEKELLLTMRLGKSKFKSRFNSALPGTEVKINAAEGDFVIPQRLSNSVVFLVGGIGIAPARSMIYPFLTQKIPQNIYLFYSNGFVPDATFVKEFQELEKKYPNFVLIPTFTQEKKLTVNGRSQLGRISMTMIKKFIINYKMLSYYIVGSHAFLNAMRQMVIDEGVDKSKIFLEIFCGYCPDHPWDSCCCSQEDSHV